MRARLLCLLALAAATPLAFACERPATDVTAAAVDTRPAPPTLSLPSVLRVVTADTDPEHLLRSTTALAPSDPSATPSTSGGPFAPPMGSVYYAYGRNTVVAKLVEGPFVLTDASADLSVFVYIMPSGAGCQPIVDWQHRPDGAELIGTVSASPGIHGARVFVRGGSVLCAAGTSYDRRAYQVSWSGFTPY